MARRIKHTGGQKRTLPIKDKRMLDRVMTYLLLERDHAKSDIKYYQGYRNYMLFLIGLNTAFRAEDLLQLRVKDVEKGYVSIKENKTGKMQNFRMNKKLYDEILAYIQKFELKSNDYLFMGQKKKDTFKVITKKVIYNITIQNCILIFEKVALANCIDFNFGLHSLRKTFGYFYMVNGGNLITLMKMYNHDEPSTTLLYVMWDTKDAEKEREATFLGGKK